MHRNNTSRRKSASPFRLMDGMIYILLLNGVARDLDEQLLVKRTNEYSRHLGHIANYTLFTHGTYGSFNPALMDESDNYVVLGQTSSQVRAYFKQKQLDEKMLDSFFKDNEKQRQRSGLGVSNQPDGRTLGEASGLPSKYHYTKHHFFRC